MTKVKVNANQEYQYITNFKVLQKAFKDHGIEKVRSNPSSKCESSFLMSFVCRSMCHRQPIPVDRLIK